MEPAVPPQHSLAFIRPIQRDGADDNDSSPPHLFTPPLWPGSHFLFFVPAFLSVTPLNTRNAGPHSDDSELAGE